jgi:signal peptidase I
MRQVILSPAQRFAIIDERGAQWGSLALLILSAYFSFESIGAIYFNQDPFPGYSFVMPAILALGFQLVRVFGIHLVARLFCRTSRLPGRARFSQLLAVYGYTNLPVMLVFTLTTFIWFCLRRQIQWAFQEFTVIAVSILIALAVALFIWRVILLVLAMRPVYAMRDIKIVAAAFLGFVVQSIILMPIALAWHPVSIGLDALKPILSEKLLEMLPQNTFMGVDSERMTTYPIYMDRLAYRFKMPQRSDLVFILPQSKDAKNNAHVLLFLGKAKKITIGRIVGMPGETVELVNGKLRINGNFWEEPYLISQFESSASLKEQRLKPGEYLILPDNRRLIKDRIDDYLVNRNDIIGRCALSKWPLGWRLYRPSAFLRAQRLSQN